MSDVDRVRQLGNPPLPISLVVHSPSTVRQSRTNAEWAHDAHAQDGRREENDRIRSIQPTPGRPHARQTRRHPTSHEISIRRKTIQTERAKPNEVENALLRGASVVEQGWCQGTWGKDHDGNDLLPRNDEIPAEICATGAIYEAIFDWKTTDISEPEKIATYERYLDRPIATGDLDWALEDEDLTGRHRRIEWKERTIVDWECDPERTLNDVTALMRKTANAVCTREIH